MKPFEAWEIRLVRALSAPLPLTPRPFAAIAERVGVSEGQVLDRLQAWSADGTIRRFGARVNHRSLGYVANGMSVWDVPDEDVEAVADYMARQPEVSHCYLRPRHSSWPHNLYAMIHGENEEQVNAVAQRIAAHAGIEAYRVLFSSRELKKTAPRYFAQDEDEEETRG
jgi:DNA-binding Lrp family transcriptional regulator